MREKRKKKKRKYKTCSNIISITHTCQDGFRDFQAQIEERRHDALHGPEHGAEAEGQQHEEEKDGPDRAARHVDDGLGENDERQTGALRCLNNLINKLISIEQLTLNSLLKCLCVCE